MIHDGAERGCDSEAKGAAPAEGDIILRIAALVGEIDRLKRERHAAPILAARARLAAVYFRKRRAQAHLAEAA